MPLELEKFRKQLMQLNAGSSKLNNEIKNSIASDSSNQNLSSNSFLLTSVEESRVKEVSHFHVSEYSDISRDNLIGMVIYDCSQICNSDIHGKPIKEGYIYFRSPESIKNLIRPVEYKKTSNGQTVRSPTYHEQLFYSLFGREWKECKDSMTVSGFAYQEGQWKSASTTFNKNSGSNYTNSTTPDARHMTDYEFELIRETVKDFINTNFQKSLGNSPHSIRNTFFSSFSTVGKKLLQLPTNLKIPSLISDTYAMSIPANVEINKVSGTNKTNFINYEEDWDNFSNANKDKPKIKNYSQIDTTSYKVSQDSFVLDTLTDIQNITKSIEERFPGIIPRFIRLPVKTIGYINPIGEFTSHIEKWVDQETKQIEKEVVKLYPNTHDLPFDSMGDMPAGWTELKQAKGLLSILQIPKKGIDTLKPYIDKAYNGVVSKAKNLSHALLTAPNPGAIYAQSVNRVFNEVAPASTDTLRSHGAYLMSLAIKADPSLRSASVEKFIQHPNFQDELSRLRLDAGLSPSQTDLLLLSVGSQYVESSHNLGNTSSAAFSSRTKLKPNPTALKKSLTTLESALVQDLSPKNQEKSQLFQTLQQTAQQSQALMQSNVAMQHTLNELQERQIKAEKMQLLSHELSALGQLGSRIAMLGGNRGIARKIDAVAQGSASSIMAFSMMSAHPVLGVVGLCNAAFSFMGLFDDDDDDDNGLEIINSQINSMHCDMMDSFKAVHHDMIQGFQSIQYGMVLGFNATMNRFDRVDQNLYAIQHAVIEGYRQLSVQQAYIGEQLSKQIAETKREILLGLQMVHADIMNCLQVLGQGMVQSFTQLNQQLNQQFNYLDNQVQHLNRELRLQTAEQMLHQSKQAQSIMSRQHDQAQLLQQQAFTLSASHRHNLSKDFEQATARRKDLAKQKTELAQAMLRDNFPMHEISLLALSKEIMYADKANEALSAGDIKLTAEGIASALGTHLEDWQQANPLDVINLLRRYACENLFASLEKQRFKQSLIHLPTWQTHLTAFLKWLDNQLVINATTINYLKQEAEDCYLLLDFLHALSEPQVMQASFLNAAIALENTGHAIEQQLLYYQNLLTQTYQKHLQFHLAQQEINRARLKSEGFNVFAEALNQRKKVIEELKITLFPTVDIVYPQPAVYFVSPGVDEKLTIILPLMDNQLPIFSKKLLQLEALGAGVIQFFYRYDAASKELIINSSFQFTEQNKTLHLVTYKIKAEQEKEIITAWQQFKNPNGFNLSENEQAELDILYSQTINSLRCKMNNNLQQDLFYTSLRQHLETINAQAGLVYMQLKLLFEPFLHDQQPIAEIINLLITKEKLELSLNQYQGGAVHPYLGLKEAKVLYQQLAEKIFTVLSNKTVYVENFALTNASLLLDNTLIKSLSSAEALTYLNNIIEKHPRCCVPYLLRMALLTSTDLLAAEKDLEFALQLQPDNNFARLRRADTLLAQGKWREATEDYCFALKHIEKAMQILSEVSADSTKDLDELKKLLYLNKVVILTRQGDAYLAGQYYAAAYHAYHQACECIPNQADLLYKQAYSLECLEKLDLAVADYEKILQLNSELDICREGIARCLIKINPGTALKEYLFLADKYPAISALGIQCAKLINADDLRIFAWLQAVVTDQKASLDSLLTCANMAAERGLSELATDVYHRVKNQLTTKEDYERIADLCANLGNIDAYIQYKEKALNKDTPDAPSNPPPQLILVQIAQRQYNNSMDAALLTDPKLLIRQGLFGKSSLQQVPNTQSNTHLVYNSI